MPRQKKFRDICNIPNVGLQIELITLPEETGMMTVRPAINKVRYVIQLKTKDVVLHELDFPTKEHASKWFETVKEAFVR